METKLKVTQAKTADLVPYAHNAKDHPDWQIDHIAASIKQFGFNDPVGVWTNPDGQLEIVAGHGRVLAAKQLGIERLPIVKLDHLDDEGRRAYVHVHNHLTEETQSDWSIIQNEIASLPEFDWSSLGFELDAKAYDPEEIIEDEPPEKADPRVKLGEVWQLGDHLLMCGDATSKDDVAKLMGGGRADVCFTSPPYNMARECTWETAPRKAMRNGAAYGDYTDDKTDEDYAALLCDALGNALEYCDDAMFNVGVLHSSKHGVAEMIRAYSDRMCDVIVWNKSQSMPHGMKSQRGMVSHRCELVFCFNQTGSRAFSHPQWEVGTMINRVDTNNASGNEFAGIHAATFPVEFAAEIVRNFTEATVVDLFGGTGTTLIAAEQLGRKCYMMELDPHYCDVIIARWEAFTGKTAERAEE